MSLVLAEGARLRAGRYELDRRLGAGAHATVWLAKDTLLERPVAVKVLAEGLADDSSWLARFRREARMAARLSHPNLVSIYDFEADVERPYLVMAYLPGGSLADRIESGGRPDPERLAGDLLRALDHIHRAGIIHRDIKPGNVLLDRDGRACLTDFGVARPQDATSITQTGQMPGTARYMAPELWRGEEAGERSDLFSLGVLLAQCAGDRSPPRLAGLIARLGAEDPDLRPESAPAALDMLGEARPGGPAEPGPLAASFASEPPEPAQPEPRYVTHRAEAPARRRWIPVAALGTAILAATVAIATGLGGGDEEPPVTEPRAERSGQAKAGGERSDDGSGGTADGASESTQTVSAPPGADGFALNDRGYSLLQSGSYEEAIPVLQQAVDALEGSGDITYAYALYNLGHALRMSGRPDEAIPILEQRLEIPDQTETVRAELAKARAEARGA